MRLSRLFGRGPVEDVALDWTRLQYLDEAFNREAADPAFGGWPDGLDDAAESRAIAACLDLPAGSPVLDVACGYGRHAIRLARDPGWRMTGVDVSPGLIEAARRRAAAAGVAADFRVGDARALGFAGAFAGALLAYNSLSVIPPADARAVLEGVRRALRPGGRFFLDMDHRTLVTWYGDRVAQVGAGRGGIRLKEFCWHPAAGTELCRTLTFAPWRLAVTERRVLKRLYDPPELRALAEAAGFRVASEYGGWDLTAFDGRQRKLLMVLVPR